MIYAKELNIKNQSTVSYDAKQRNVNFSNIIDRTDYINYRDEQLIGGGSYNSGYVIQGFITSRDCEGGDYAFDIPVIMLKYRYVNSQWQPTGTYISVSYIKASTSQGVGRLDVEYGGRPAISAILGRIRPSAVAGMYLNFLPYYPIPFAAPYTQSELEDYAQDMWSDYPDIISAVNNLGHGAVICTVDNFVAFTFGGQRYRAGSTQGKVYAELLAEGEGELRNLHPTCIIPFASDDECSAAKCAYTQWTQAPYYPIT